MFLACAILFLSLKNLAAPVLFPLSKMKQKPYFLRQNTKRHRSNNMANTPATTKPAMEIGDSDDLVCALGFEVSPVTFKNKIIKWLCFTV